MPASNKVCPQVNREVAKKRTCLSQANADLAEAADKLQVIRKKLAVRLTEHFALHGNLA